MLDIKDILDCKLKIKTDKNVIEITFSELTLDKKVIIFGVPGAFTQTCSAKHLPSFINNYEKFLDLGIEDIICISVNDPFVINAWGEFNNANKKIKMMSDIGGVLAKRMDIEEDFGPNLLMRMKRFAMIILDNQIKYYVIDERGDYGKTDAENIITVLKNIL